jgi:hypothetical protein
MPLSLTVGLVCLAVLGAGGLWAQTARQRHVEFRRTSSAVVMTTDIPELFDRRSRGKLDSGFWHHALMRIATYHVGKAAPLRVALRSCRLRYEVWEEYYEVQLQGPQGVQNRRVATAPQAVALCTKVHRFPVLPLPPPRSGQYLVEVIAELNPLSPDLLQSVREWLRSPQGGPRPLGQGDNFFGSVVSIFVNNRIGRSDRMVHFRTQRLSP